MNPPDIRDSVFDAIGGLLDYGGDLEWLYHALVRRLPKPVIFNDNPGKLTYFQIMAMGKATEIYQSRLPKQKKR